MSVQSTAYEVVRIFLDTITPIHSGKRDGAAFLRFAYEVYAYLTYAVSEGDQILSPPAMTGIGVWSLEHVLELILFNGVVTEDSDDQCREN